jgi:hypothetical protein
MKFTVLAALLSSAAAFAPAKSAARTSAVQMGYENELGVIAPTGFFDPLGLSSNIDQETFDAYRTAELKVRVFVLGSYMWTRAHIRVSNLLLFS